MATISSNKGAVRSVIGQFAAPLTVAIIGMPRVGKSTLFNSMAQHRISDEHSSLETIKATVIDQNPDLDWLAQTYEAERKNCAPIHIIDTPSLLRGVRLSLGVGSNFLEEIRQAHSILHVLRAFEDDSVSHADGKLNILRDIECVNQELISKDCQIICSRIQGFRDMQSKKKNDRKIDSELELCFTILSHLRSGMEVRFIEWTDLQVQTLQTYGLLTAKPMIYMVNVNMSDFQIKNNPLLWTVYNWAKENNKESVIPFSCHTQEESLQNGRIRRVINAVLEACQVIKLYITKATEVNYWMVRKGTSAHIAARSVRDGYRALKVIKLTDLKECGTEAAVKELGKQKDKYMTYVLQNGDVISFES